MPLAPGQVLSCYEILGPLGAGGMGEVYRARDTRLEREVAIKVLPEHLADDPERLRRFEREARTLASLNHPNVAGIHGVDREGDVWFLALELVPGEDLAERLARGALPLDEALDVCRQVAEGLEAAHEAGVVHRDLKPANVRVTPGGQVKVLDFGLAKAGRKEGAPGSGSARTDSFLATEEGVVLGTPTYMSPEQARGRPVDRRTDVWAFGCVLFECLTGRRAFGGDSFGDVVASVLGDTPDASLLPAGTPPRVRELLARCLEKDARRRLRDIGEARVLLEDPDFELAAMGAGSGSVPGVGRGGARGRGLSALVGLLLGGALGLLAARASRPEPIAPAPLRLVLATPEFDGLYEGLAAAPVLSRDGRHLAYPGAGGLRVRSLATLDDREVPGSAKAGGNFWSPDSTTLAFPRDGALWAWTLGRSESRRIGPLPLASEFNGGIWMPDGTLYFSVFGGDLYSMPSSGGEATVVLERAPGEVDFHLPAWLPDPSEFLAVAHRDTGGQQVFAYRVAERERVPLLEMEGLASAAWSPTGHLLLMRNWSTEDLWGVEYEPAQHRVVGDPFPLEAGLQCPSVAEGGSMVCVQGERAALFDLFWVARDGSASPVPGGPFRGLHAPAVSPEGRRIAYSGVDGDNRDIWVLDVERGTRRRLTTAPSNDDSPHWSADGRTVFFETWLPGQNAIWRVDAEGAGEPVLVADRAVDAAPLVDGEDVLFRQSGAGAHGIDRIGLEPGATSASFVASSAQVDQLAPSPGGRWLAHRGYEAGGPEVFLRPLDEPTRRTQVSLGGGENPFWDAKGERLYFVRGQDLMEVVLGPAAQDPADAPPPQKVLDLADLALGKTESLARRVADGLSADGSFLLSRRSPSDPRAGILYWRDVPVAAR